MIWVLAPLIAVVLSLVGLAAARTDAKAGKQKIVKLKLVFVTLGIVGAPAACYLSSYYAKQQEAGWLAGYAGPIAALALMFFAWARSKRFQKTRFKGLACAMYFVAFAFVVAF